MGTWAPHSFGNDEALDWLNDLIEEHDIYFIHNTLEIIADFPSDDKPEAWDCCCAVAAAEMVAAAKGKPGDGLPPVALEWLDAYAFEADDEALQLANKAIERIQRDSWLRDEWVQGGGSEKWYQCLNELKSRLAA